jgi:hypothetical protein
MIIADCDVTPHGEKISRRTHSCKEAAYAGALKDTDKAQVLKKKEHCVALTAID